MIICKAPLRISVGGGGTDLPSYFEGIGTVFSSLAINKYVSVCITRRLVNEIFIRYSKNEVITDIRDIKHEIIRAVLIKYGLTVGVEIASFGDVPGGTGLGSSGAFTVALCSAVKSFLEQPFDKYSIAELATQIEMVDLKKIYAVLFEMGVISLIKDYLGRKIYSYDNSIFTLGNKICHNNSMQPHHDTKFRRIKIYIWLNDKDIKTHPLYYLKKTQI